MTIERIIERTPVVPVVVLNSVEKAAPLARALLAGGLPLAEVTFRTEAAEESIRVMAGESDMVVGAGTVVTAEQVDRAYQAGASFIVSPGFSQSVVERAREHGLHVFPGATSATEIMACLDLGVTTVKFFPASTSGGAAAIKALSAPFGQVQFIPTGGINLTNIHDYLSVSSVRAVGGSWMVPSSAIESGDFDHVEELVRQTVESVEQC